QTGLATASSLRWEAKPPCIWPSGPPPPVSSPTAKKGRNAMRRAYLLTAGMAVTLAAGATAFVGSHSHADQSKAGPAEPGARPAQLSIGAVVLFSSGVGFFQREGVVEGDARVDLSFPVADINDLLKSLVLRDLDGGHVAAVSYDSNAPLER